MAKVRKNSIAHGFSGGVGDIVFQHMPDGNTYARGKPDFSHRKFSKGQKQHQSRFQLAVMYAREAAKTQPIYTKLAAGTIMSAYNFALSDWFNPPVIHKIERKDGRVRVQASDNVMVVKVVITVLDDEGKVVEKKDAGKIEGDWWEVELIGDGKVVVEAWDLAGNVGRGVS